MWGLFEHSYETCSNRLNLSKDVEVGDDCVCAWKTSVALKLNTWVPPLFHLAAFLVFIRMWFFLAHVFYSLILLHREVRGQEQLLQLVGVCIMSNSLKDIFAHHPFLGIKPAQNFALLPWTHLYPISCHPPQKEPSPGTRYERSSSDTRRTVCGNGTCRPHRRPTARTTSSSSTTACRRRPAPPSPTSPTTCAGRTTTTSCTSTPPRTTRSCPYKTRSELWLTPFQLVLSIVTVWWSVCTKSAFHPL